MVRLLYVLMYPQVSVFSDPEGYDITGWGLLHDKGFPLEQIGNEYVGISRPPAYPIFLASIYWVFGHNYQAVRVIQAILDSFACLIIFYLGSRAFNDLVGYLASICYAFYYPGVIYTGLLYTESVFTLILALSTLFLFLAIERDSLKYWIGTGIFLGLATLISSRSVFLPLFIFGGLLWKTLSIRKSWKGFTVIVLCMLVLFSPWTLRNYLVTGRFILLENYNQDMTGLWLATNPYGVMGWNTPEVKKLVEHLPPNERTEFFQKEAWKNFKRYPSAYFRNSIKRFLVLWISSHSNYISGLEESFRAAWQDKDRKVFAFKIFLLGINTLVIALGFIGLWFSRGKWRRDCLAIILPIFYLTALHTFYVSSPRLQIPMVPYIMIFAIVGVLKLFRQSQKQELQYCEK